MKLRALLAFVIGLGLVALFASRPKAVTPKPCPVSLTNPDGQEMTLEKYDLRVAVDGPLSLTEMEMVFRNPQPRQMEGRFLYLLPPGATISRFAKEVNGHLMEGEVVERLRAQAIYTEILHTMRDPALLEMDQGNRFSARVFPIPANGTVRLLLGYSQRVPSQDGMRKITVPLAGIPKIGEFNYSVVVNEIPGQQIESMAGVDVTEAAHSRVLHAAPRKDYEPQTDLTLTFRTETNAPRIRSIHGGNFQMLAWRPEVNPGEMKDVERDWVFYFDTSASNADMEKRRLDAIDQLLTAVVPVLRSTNSSASARAFDVDVKEIQPAVSMNSKGGKPIMPEIVGALRARHALGATNLEAALKAIGEQARAAEKPQRFVLVSDGIATWGARETRELLAALGDWPDRHVLHALVIGAKQDEKTLNAIVEKTHGRIVTLPLNDEVDTNVPKVISELTTPLGRSYEFYDESAEWIYPKTFRDVRPGGELVVLSALKKDTTSKIGAVTRGADNKAVDTQLTVTPTEVSDFAPLLQREAYAAYLSHLEQLEQNEAKPEKRDELRKTRLDISVKNRVLCPLTSMLVLESQWDYQRFQIDPATLADVMVIGDKGIEVRKRTPADLGIPVPEKQAAAMKAPQAQPPKPAEAKGQLENGRGAMHAMKKAEDASKKDLAAPEYDKEDKAVDPSNFRGLRQAGRNAVAANGEEAGEALDMAAVAPGGTSSSGGGGGTSSGGGGDGGGGGSLEDGITMGVRTGAGRRDAAAEQSPDIFTLAGAANRGTPASNAAPAAVADHFETTTSAPNVAEPRPASSPARSEPATAATNAPPAPPTPNARPLPAQQGAQRQQERVARINNPNLAPWAAEGLQTPNADQLNALRAQVAGSPRDRNLRNQYSNALFKAKKWDELQGQAFEWLPFDPENPAVYEYLGKSATGLHDYDLALRAMTSIAEIAPNRAALLARSGWLLMTAEKYDLAEAMFREALKNRKDDPNIYRGLALSLWLGGKFEQAAKELEAAGKLDSNPRYGDVKRVLREELAYVIRAWQTADAPAAAAFIRRTGIDAEIQRVDALRATMCWETDANDVDLHVIDPNGEECYYSHAHNASGLELYSDQTQGLGPEVIRTARTLPGAYYIGVNYFSAGAMGVSRGVVVVMKPENGVVKKPEIVPFCLVQGGTDMRLITTVDY